MQSFCMITGFLAFVGFLIALIVEAVKKSKRGINICGIGIGVSVFVFLLGIFGDTTGDFLAMFGFLGGLASLVVFIVNLVRKNNKIAYVFVAVFLVCCVVFGTGVSLSISPTENISENRSSDINESNTADVSDETDKVHVESETPTVQSSVEEFARENGVSIAFSESLDKAVREVTDKYNRHFSIEDVDSFRETNDWAEGKRYTIWLGRQYVLTVYEQNDEVVSIRRSNGDFVYSK